MRKKRKFYTLHPIDYSKHLPDNGSRLTGSQRQLYNLIYSFGVNGCWMSNATIGKILHRCCRTIRTARGRLAICEAIIMARGNPRTFSMWASRHPAVAGTPILYFKGGKITNPMISQSGRQLSGGQKLPPGGAKIASKRKEYSSLRDYILAVTSFEGGRLPAGTESHLSGSAPETPGGPVAGEKLSPFETNLLNKNCRQLSRDETIGLLFEWRWLPKKTAIALARLFGE